MSRRKQSQSTKTNISENNAIIQTIFTILGVIVAIVGVYFAIPKDLKSEVVTKESIPIPSVLDGLTSNWSDVRVDSFDNQDVDKWIASEDKSEAITSVRTRNGRLNINISTKEFAIYKTFMREEFLTGNNFALSVEAKLTAQYGCGYGLIFNGDTSENYYVFSLYSDENFEQGIQYKISRVTPVLSQKREVLQISTLPNDIGIPNSLSVVSVGEYTVFYVNGTPLTKLQLKQDKAALHGNRTGLELFVCPNMISDYVFDNFQIRSPREMENSVKINLPSFPPTLQSTYDDIRVENEFSLEKADLITDEPLEFNVDSSEVSGVMPLQDDALANFKVSAKFSVPEEERWSIGFYFWRSDRSHCKAYITSETVWKIECLDSVEYIGLCDCLEFEKGRYNSLLLIAENDKVIFEVNDHVCYFGGIHYPNKSEKSQITLDIAITNDEATNYSVHIKDVNIWSILDK